MDLGSGNYSRLRGNMSNNEYYVVITSGFVGSNDDYNDTAVAGVYSSQKNAVNALTKLMRDELLDMDVETENLSFEELVDEWTDHMETEAYTIHKIVLDAPLLSIEEAEETSINLYSE